MYVNITLYNNIIYIYILIFGGILSSYPGTYMKFVLTNNQLALISLRSRSHVKASMVLTRADHLFIHDYIRSLLHIIIIPILMVRTGLVPVSYCMYN